MMARLYIGLGAGLIFLSAQYFSQAALMLENIEKLAHIAVPTVLALALLKDVLNHMIGKNNRETPPRKNNRNAVKNNRKAVSQRHRNQGF